MSPRGDVVIAATLGWDVVDMREHRYQSTRTSRAIYSVGDRYFAIGKAAPPDQVGGPWYMAKDQVFAKKAGTILWACEVQA